MLRNPIYQGRVVSPRLGIDTEGDFQPIVSVDLFNAAQAAARKNGHSRRQRCWDHPDFPLRRSVHCGACGTALTGSWSKGRSAKYAYYHALGRDAAR